MTVRYTPLFLRKVKRLDVRIRKILKEKLAIFTTDPFNPHLDNHALRDKYLGYRSIDITGDYRAIYQEKVEGDELIALFVLVGTHEELYRDVD
ncbi:type II toxin-antitoxin system RelE/ParE family toxin [Candidatus Microgenomates bacterium]|nr:type II toxin-antitoxin system RelE/ParE family toxin [Candidatus Microgenomates bacterium]